MHCLFLGLRRVGEICEFHSGVQNAYSDDDTFALLYGVFAAKANSVRAALSVAEQRFANVAEFESMAADCHRAYFSIRQQLLTPIVQKTIEQLLRFIRSLVHSSMHSPFPFEKTQVEAILLNGSSTRKVTTSFRCRRLAGQFSGMGF